MKTHRNPFLCQPVLAAALALANTASAEILSFDGNVATNITTHNINATDWADYVGGTTTFNSANDWGRLYWRGSGGDGQYIHFDLSPLTGLTVIAPTTVTLQNANPTWGASVNDSFVATVNGSWTAAGGASIPGATLISNAVNATGNYGSGASVSWAIGFTSFQDIVDNQGSFNGLAVIGGAGSTLHFTGPMNPFLTVHTGTLTATTGIITADTGASTWNGSNYAFVASNAYHPTLNTLTISGELIAGTSGAGTVTINNGGTVALNQAGNYNYYWALDGTTINAGGKLTSNGHSHIHNLTLAGGELASTGVDGTYGGWYLDDPTAVTGGVTSTISAQQVTLGSGVFNVDSGSTLNFTGSASGDSLTKDGSGTMLLSGANTYTGAIMIDGGVLELAPNTAWVLQGGGAVTVNSGATLQGNSSVANQLNGLTLNDGTVSATGGNADWGNFYLTGNVAATGTSSLNADIALRASNVDFNVASGGTLTVGGVLHNGAYFGIYSGAPANVSKSGDGTMVLSGANTYTGGTTVSGGTLSLTTPFLNDDAPVTIGFGAVLDLDFTGNDTVGSLEIDGSGPLPAGTYNSSHPTYGLYFTGTGSLVVLGSNGTWTSLSDGNWSDDVNWDGNTVAIGYDATATFNAAAGVTVTVDSARKIGNLAFDVSDYTIAGGNILTLEASGTPNISVTSGRSATISANVAGIGGMEKSGGGTLVFTGTKSYTGGTTVSGGTLELQGATGGNAQIHGSLNVGPGATVAITGGDGTGFGFYNNPVNTINVDGGTINASGTTHLGFGTYANMILDNGAALLGQWQWNGDGSLNFSSYGDITNTISGLVILRADAGANHTFFVDDGAAAVDLSISASLAEHPAACNMVKIGPGRMLLSGSNSYTGNTLVNDGTLEVTSAGSLHFRPTTNTATNQVTGTATLSFLGTIHLDLGAADIANGNAWTLFNVGSLSSATVTPAAITSTAGSFGKSGTTWTLSSGDNTWTFEESTGVLNLAVASSSDFDTWGGPYGLAVGDEDGDLDNDGITNFEEYAFGLLPNSGSSVNPISVPFDKASGTFSYTRRDSNLQNPALTYSVWYSTDLAGWTEDTGAVEGTPVLNGEVETVPVTISNSLLTNPKLFIQVRAQ